MDQSVEYKQVAEKEADPHLFNRILKVAAYPVATIAGFWVAKKEISDGVYDTLKNAKAFDTIQADLQPKNEANVTNRGASTIEIEEFLSQSARNKNTYRKATSDCMSHYGLGNSLREFPAQWEYVSRSVRRNAIIQGMTVTGIAIGAMLTIANSKSLIDYFGGINKEDKTR